LAKIAVEFDLPPADRDGGNVPNLLKCPLAHGDGWSVSDVICNAGPGVPSREEQHSAVSIAVVRAGSFQYASSAGRELMTPGSLMLGNAGQYFQCGHEHDLGDRCISFVYAPEWIGELAADAGVPARTDPFRSLRLPPLRELSNVIARACSALAQSKISRANPEHPRFWEETAVELAVMALQLAKGTTNNGSSAANEARVTRIIRMIETRPAEEHHLVSLAREARLSRYHFLRIFRQLTGLTPHQYVLRSRLRHAATRLLREPTPILDIALDSGFGDVSNFNHAFRAEFGLNPRAFRVGFRETPFTVKQVLAIDTGLTPGYTNRRQTGRVLSNSQDRNVPSVCFPKMQR
jgi:AraC family transcriptional regulator